MTTETPLSVATLLFRFHNPTSRFQHGRDLLKSPHRFRPRIPWRPPLRQDLRFWVNTITLASQFLSYFSFNFCLLIESFNFFIWGFSDLCFSDWDFRDQFTKDDIKVFGFVLEKPGDNFPNAAKWYDAVSSHLAARFVDCSSTDFCNWVCFVLLIVIQIWDFYIEFGWYTLGSKSNELYLLIGIEH